MRYIPNTEAQKNEMLNEIGVSSFDELLRYIPERALIKSQLNLPDAKCESDIVEEIVSLSQKNASFQNFKSLAGAGAYQHFIPEVIRTVVSRSEFYTAYTPYQPELSQGTLQTIFEVQTHLALLTGMDAVVPSLYDGASATAEAVLMSMRLTGRKKIAVSELLHPHYLETIKTYLEPHTSEIIPLSEVSFATNPHEIEEKLDSEIACVVVQSPNYFGGIEDVAWISEVAHRKNVLVVQVVAESLSLAMLKTPAELGVDIVAGEAQSFGIDLNFGGPYNGYLATKTEYLRQLPGRIVGETTDRNGKRAFVMTLRAREQDIRREKATSNICSNHNLQLFAINAFISLYGKEGLHELALRNFKASHYLFSRLSKIDLFESKLYPFFNEFVLKIDSQKEDIIKNTLIENKFLPPITAKRLSDNSSTFLIFAVTEIFRKRDLDKVAEVLGRI